MNETDVLVTSTGAQTSATGVHRSEEWGESSLSLVPSRWRFRHMLPSVALSIFISTASVFNDPWLGTFPRESSAVFGLRPARRRISLAEARRIALSTMTAADQRRVEFAQLEGEQFLALYDWELS